MITQTIDLNLVPGSVCPVIHLNQYDKYTNGLVFNLYQDSVFNVPNGAAVTLRGTKPDGYGFDYSAASASGNVCTFDVTEQMTAVDGAVPCELRVTQGTKVIGTQNFTLMIEKAPLNNDTVISDSDIPAIAAAADYADEAASSAAQAAISAAQADADVAQIYGLGTKIGNSDNLNDYKTSGKYYAEAGQSITNAPISGGFTMLVWYTFNQNRLVQVVFGLDGSINVRALYGNNTWTDWWKSDNAKLFGGTTLLTSSNNLNNVTSNGEYYFSSNSRPSNAPFTVGGRVTVERGIGINQQAYIRQTAVRYNVSDGFFTRVSSDSGSNWTHWYQYSMTDTGS